jgi:hypothetical protein
MLNRKVYDSDIAVTPLLRAIAEQYVREYVGNFDMMIQAKQYLNANGALSEAMIRPVLNTLRSDVARSDLWAAVSAVLRHPSTPRPVDLAEVVPITRPRQQARQRAIETPRRPTYLRLGEDQFTIKAKFATCESKAANPVLHWIKPEGHQLEWKLDWYKRNNFEEVTALGSGYQRLPRFRINLFCSGHRNNLNLWNHRPTVGEAWSKRHAGDETPIPDCRSCLRHIAMSHMDEYPPDREVEQ